MAISILIMKEIMNRSEIITELKKFFCIQELVCNHTYSAFGDKSWQFLDTEILHTLLFVRRDILKVPCTINDWHKGGVYSQRGLRCNICQLTRDKTIAFKIYLTAHANGAAFDVIPTGMSAEQARKLIEANKHLLPYAIRLENAVNWLHMDCYDYMNGNMVNYFNS